MLFSAAVLLASCSKAPSAQAELSNDHPKVGERIEVKNLSVDGDVSYIKMNGEGLFDGKLFVNKTFIATQKNFQFTYTTPGTYEVEVSTESTDFMSNTSKVTSKYTISVSPDAAAQQ